MKTIKELPNPEGAMEVQHDIKVMQSVIDSATNKERKRVLGLIDEKIKTLQRFLEDKNAIYSQDYDKVRAKIKVLKELKKRIKGTSQKARNQK